MVDKSAFVPFADMEVDLSIEGKVSEGIITKVSINGPLKYNVQIARMDDAKFLEMVWPSK